MKRLGAILFLVVLGLAAAPGAFALPVVRGVPDDGVLDFTIERNGKAIGRHVYRFDRHDGRLEVVIRTDIDYRLLFLPLYRFRHESREVWQDGKLAKLTSVTNDNGAEKQLTVRPAGGVLRAEGKAREAVAEDIVPASLWNAALLRHDRVIGTIDGGVMAIQATYLGEETVKVEGRPVLAHHFRLTGEFERELWYGTDGVLLRVRFTASDGSEIQYVLN